MLVEYAVKNNVQTLGLTDHRFLSGALEFYEACMFAGIKPIIGLEIDLTYHGVEGYLTLLAKNKTGWSNLSKLSTALLIDEKPLTFEHLHNHKAGIIVITGGPRGILRQLILSDSIASNFAEQFLIELKNSFMEDCFIEIQRYANGPLKNESLLLELARKHHIRIIATQNIFYLNPADHVIYRTLTAIRHNVSIHGLSKRILPPGASHFPAAEDFAFRFKDIPEALENLSLIQEQYHMELPIGQTHYPIFSTPNGQSQSNYLRSKAYQGAREFYQHLTPEITERLDYELQIISSMGYEPVFLIVEDLINHARMLGIPTSSRGSAASSLVAHCLNITSPDPLALNLYFERFLNPARKKPPDIDTDIASHRRDEIIQYVFEKYGADRVAMVGTVNRYRPKSAFNDVAKVYGLSPETIRQLSKKLPSSFHSRQTDDLSSPFAPLLREGSISIIKDIIADAQAIVDNPRHLSVHPGGIIIAPINITDLFLVKDHPKGVTE